MDKLFINLKLKSPTLIGSGEGWGSLIDTDIVYDDLGLPSFPARRLKGLLRESALEVMEMFDASESNLFNKDIIDHLFGTPQKAGAAAFCNLNLEGYAEAQPWLEWAFDKYSDLVSTETVIDTLTEIRQQTAIDGSTGTAKESSLRTLRLLNKGLSFAGPVDGNIGGLELDLLALACANLRHVGSSRNRGLGEVSCLLTFEGEDWTSKALRRVKGDA